MKKILICYLLCITIQYVLAQDIRDNKLTLRYKDTELGIVLKELSEKHKIPLSYSSTMLPVQELISISVEDVSLEEVLQLMFQQLPISYSVSYERVILKNADFHQTVRGRVVDQATQMPIIGATVVLKDSDPIIGSVTNLNGEFRIEKIRVGRRSFVVSFIGYEPKVMDNLLIGTGKEILLDIEIVESVIQMKELVINANQTRPAPINKLAVVSARSFTTEETKRYAVSLGDPGRLASAYAGVSGGDDTTNELVIRGNSPRGLLWMLEGIEIPSPSHFASEGSASGGISMLSTNVMSRSDFFTGAFPSQYGNALSGVFDINLRRGNNEKREHTLQAGLLGLDLATEGPFTRGKQSSYLVNYRYSTLAILDGIGLQLLEENEENIFQDLSFKINLPTEKLGRFSVFGLGGLSKEEEAFNNFFCFETSDMGVVGPGIYQGQALCSGI